MLKFIEFFATNIDIKIVETFWYSNENEELVKQCWREGCPPTYYLDQNNQEVFVGEPPEKELSSLLRVLLKTQTNQEFIHLF